MPKVTASVTTILKVKIVESTDLTSSEKIIVNKGHQFYVTDYGPEQNHHMSMRLASPLLAADRTTQLQEVFGYIPHLEFTGSPNRFKSKHDASQLIKLDVPYFRQLDNDWHSIHGMGGVQCNLTSHAMLADYLLDGKITQMAQQKGLKEPESAYAKLLAKYGRTTDHPPHTAALKALGIESYFSTTLSAKDIMRSLCADIPVVIGVDYKKSGHICCIVGHDPAKKVYLVHDPYGIRQGASDSYNTNANGAFDTYSYDMMRQVYWTPKYGSEGGWGRIVTAVKGRPTGLPTGL